MIGYLSLCTLCLCGEHPILPVTSNSLAMPTEDYPGPSRSHPEKEDTNDPPRPAGVDPVRPPMPEKEELPLQEEKEEEEE
jgi:hypothetical protein